MKRTLRMLLGIFVLVITTLALTAVDALAATPGAWSPTGALVIARSRHTATLLPDGRVLVVGGQTVDLGNITTTATAEFYDPQTGTWNPTGSMITPRSRHTAILLLDGKVLVAGGRNNNLATATAELFDPGTGIWSPTGMINIPRDFHSATLLADGRVLVTGGISTGDGRDNAAEKTAEIYDPNTGVWSSVDHMAQSRWGHTATLLRKGKVIMKRKIFLTSFFVFLAAMLLWTATRTSSAQDKKGDPAKPGSIPTTIPPSRDGRGTFRVTLLGFVVNHETRDTLLETDGKRDEVFQAPVVLFFDRDRGLETRSFSAFGPVYGDTNNHPTVIQAGSASDRGGLRTVDPFPAPRPWEGRTPPGPGLGFPSVLFEGELRPVHNAAIIIPSLWEYDGSAELFTPYMDSIARVLPTISTNVGHVLAVDNHFEFRSRPGDAFGLESAITLDERLYDMRNRPIGMKSSAPGRFSFQPQVLVLTYEGARDAISRDNGFGAGVIEVRYDEARELEGSYSLYFKVERVR